MEISVVAHTQPFDSLNRLARERLSVPWTTIVQKDRRHLESAIPAGFIVTPLLLTRLQADDAKVGNDIATFFDAAYVSSENQLARIDIESSVILAFYAASPVTALDGTRLGTLYVFDTHRRHFDSTDTQAFLDLSAMAAAIIERSIAQEELAAVRLSKERMSLAIAGSETGIWDRNVETGEIHYSDGWKALLGYSATDLTSNITDSYSRLHPDDAGYVRAAMQEHFDQITDSYSVEHRIRCKDGSYKWICSRGKVVARDAHGNALRMIGTTTDLTAIRTLSEKLQQSVELITQLTNEIPGFVFQKRLLTDGSLSLPYVSAGIEDIYGLTPLAATINAALIHDVIVPEDLPGYLASLMASATALTPWHCEYRVELPSLGIQWRQGDARPQRQPDGSTLWHGLITDVTARKRSEAELQGFATIDFLTQLANRRHFMVQMEAEHARLQRGAGLTSAVLMFDLDHFKAINDKWGHAVGDLALRHFSQLLQAELRKIDIVGRIGGEEFAVVMNCATTEAAMAFARRIQARLKEAPVVTGAGSPPISMTVSVGVAALHANDKTVDAALSLSDMALYQAKQNGRNRIVRHVAS